MTTNILAAINDEDVLIPLYEAKILYRKLRAYCEKINRSDISFMIQEVTYTLDREDAKELYTDLKKVI